MQSIIILALVGLLTVTATSGQSLMPPSPFEATECGNMGYNSMQIGPNCYFWVNGSFTMEQAREQCVMEGGILASLHEKADYDMLKGVVHDKYEFSDANNHLAVFWLDQMFDYDVSYIILFWYKKKSLLRVFFFYFYLQTYTIEPLS